MLLVTSMGKVVVVVFVFVLDTFFIIFNQLIMMVNPYIRKVGLKNSTYN